jgi:beta-N-acetylhexosaminidase
MFRMMGRSFWGVVVHWLALAGLLGSLFSPVLAQGRDPVAEHLSKMTPEERVGQLFLVSFTGTDVGPTSAIYDLIANRHVGGVVLMAANNNFAGENTVQAAYEMIFALQSVEAKAAFEPAQGAAPNVYVPLFIGISQEGGGWPNDQILTGLTPLPDQMAIGATWNRDLAQNVGAAMGRELSAIGFNFYLGLSLDVQTLTNPATNSDLSTRSFGGDPYWVSELGKAYVTGLHDGASGRMLVVAKHFPGSGGANRPAEQEISTVRRSLDELKSVELLPFFAVTGRATEPGTQVDGLLVSHIRYQGFQGNIRATTRPISLDQQALGQMLALPELAAWRSKGGLIVSDNLGTAAVRRFYDPDLRTFAGRLVARDAFLAGNDLLYMGNMVSSDAPDNYTTIVRSLEFFAQKYREDSAFASRVDESVYRILAAKYRLYGTFSQPMSPPLASDLAVVGTGQSQVFQVARSAATLISPLRSDLTTVLPSPPGQLDRIVFLSDSRVTRQCAGCNDINVLSRTAFQLAVQRLYGPLGGALITPSYLSSFTFEDVNLMLNEKAPTPDLYDSLNRATWVVISTLDMPEGSEQLTILRRLLTERQRLLNNKKVILFSFSAPFYLDATDISKLTAYYCLYSESEPFIDAAVRLLFQEISPAGALPVSVPGVGYDLISATAPDPNQIIRLSLNLPSAQPTPTGSAVTPEPTIMPILRVGDTISLRTGIIVDHNQRPVPDGTVVRFTFSQGESGLFQQVDVVTSQGMAIVAYRLDKPGLVEIRAVSEPARVSDTIQLDVTSDSVSVLISTPTSEMIPTATVTPTLPPPTPTPTPIPISSTMTGGYPSAWGWFMVMLVLFAGTMLSYWLGTQVVEPRWAVRWALLVFLSGILVYNYLILDFPGAGSWLGGRGLSSFLQAVLVGQAVGFVLGWVWRSAAEGGNQAHEQ